MAATRDPSGGAREASASTAQVTLVLVLRHDHLHVSQPGTSQDHYIHLQSGGHWSSLFPLSLKHRLHLGNRQDFYTATSENVGLGE